MPVKAEVDQKYGSQSEGYNANGGQHVAEMAPVSRHEVQNATGDKGEGNGVGACHPLAMHSNLPVARCNQGGRGADHPGGGLHGGSREAGAAGRQGDPRKRADKDADDIDAAEDSMELQVTLSKSRRELDRAGK